MAAGFFAPTPSAASLPMYELLLVLALLSMFYVLGPVIFKATHRQPLPRTRPVAPDEAPAPVAKALARWDAFLDDRMPLAGVHELTIPDVPGDTLPFSEEHLNPEPLHPDPPAGHVLHFVDRQAGVHGLDYVTPRLSWQVFLTRFDGDEEVVTTNVSQPSSFAPHPRVHAVRFAGVRDLARLRTLHDAHVRHVMGARVPSPIPTDEALAGFVEEHEERAVERQREMGMMNLRGGAYRPTWKGAFVSIWQMLPPLFFVQLWRHARLGAALRRAVDVKR